MKNFKLGFIGYLLTGLLILSGLMLIFNAFQVLPQIQIVATPPADINATIEALQGISPTQDQIKHAAALLSTEKDIISILTSSLATIYSAHKIIGGLLAFSGIALMFILRSKNTGV